ncbi:interferon-induced protein with tetratricopeptide repeats 5-like [Silurus meridionalis]|uniref:interferon-induced protein with tetratricopeptide repeats 5-like n=1 Tax=Silurus meridionalis TaxID=175797 RepID=UPI001EEA0D37|nr:interferon-induced protein with tetratricopeptide repeats 5-like [Silurus meridionalis]
MDTLSVHSHALIQLKKEELDLTDLLNRLEQHADFNLGEKAGLAQTYNSLGYVKHLLGSSQDALGYLQKCVELTKESRLDDCDKWLIVPYGNLAWLQYQLKCFSECESYLEKIRSIVQELPDSSLGLCHQVLGEKAWAYFKFSRKYYNQAKECFEKVLELEHMNAEWNCGYAFVLHRTETQCPSVRTIKQLRQAIDTNPDNDELKALLAVRLGEAKEYNEAESLVEEALEGSPNAPNVIRYVGKFLRIYGSVERSIALLKRVLEKSPTSAFIQHQLALCYKRKAITLQREESQNSPSAGAEIQRSRSQCIYYLDKTTELKPGFITAMIELANQYSKDGDLDRAEEMFQQTLHKAKEKNEYLQQVYLSYGQFQQYRRRSLPEAITCYMECLKIDEGTVDGKKSAKQLGKINDKRSSKSPGSRKDLRIPVSKEERNAGP